MPNPSSRSERWRLTSGELRLLLSTYEKAVEKDGQGFIHPSQAERALLGDGLLSKRAAASRHATQVIRRFVDFLLEDLRVGRGSWGSRGASIPPDRSLAAVDLDESLDSVPLLPPSSYGSLASVLCHLYRDWSADCEHVIRSTYQPAIRVLQSLCRPGSSVLLPGAGLGRLAVELAAVGYQVEANDASRLFLTFADFLLNRAPGGGVTICPMAHVFSENWGLDVMYREVCVPSPTPAEILGIKSGDTVPWEAPITLVPGDFVKAYGRGGPKHRKFDAILTCFFIDTASDVVELVQAMDSLLAEGGVWVNIGPLNWRSEARLKLSWEEVVSVWEGLGYEFVTQQRLECDYHLMRSMKMYTESYTVSLSAAVKNRAGRD